MHSTLNPREDQKASTVHGRKVSATTATLPKTTETYIYSATTDVVTSPQMTKTVVHSALTNIVTHAQTTATYVHYEPVTVTIGTGTASVDAAPLTGRAVPTSLDHYV